MLQAADHGALGRPGRPPSLGHHGHAGNQQCQATQGLAPVFLQAAEFLGLDDQHPVLADALILEGQQARLDVRRQGRSGDVEAQMDGIRHLVHVLPPGPLGADGGDLDLFGGNGQRGLHGVSVG